MGRKVIIFLVILVVINAYFFLLKSSNLSRKFNEKIEKDCFNDFILCINNFLCTYTHIPNFTIKRLLRKKKKQV